MPQNDEAHVVSGEKTDDFRFSLTPPEVLGVSETSKKKKSYRDIIRTIVMRGMSVSMKSIELPDIWHAGDWEKQSTEVGRDARVVKGIHWWVDDKPIDYKA
jgi:hypothetical protein